MDGVAGVTWTVATTGSGGSTGPLPSSPQAPSTVTASTATRALRIRCRTTAASYAGGRRRPVRLWDLRGPAIFGPMTSQQAVRTTTLVLLLTVVRVPVAAQQRDPEPLFSGSDAAWAGGFLAGTAALAPLDRYFRSEEHTSELQSLMRTSYAVFCLKTQKRQTTH